MALPTSWLYDWWTKVYLLLLRPMLKWLLRYVTGKCELLRITYEERDKAKRAKCIESSLNSSSNGDIHYLASGEDFDVAAAVENVIKVKDIVPEVHPEFQAKLKDSLLRIWGYNRILKEAETIRLIKYDSENREHERQLLELWDLYNSNVPLPNRVGPHWQDMGFQGLDPKTDFRGMGLLGLQQMIYFAMTYPEPARHVLSQSHHPKYGFSFAIVAINITGMAHVLLQKRKLRSHFYSLDKLEPELSDFHKVYCYLLHEFTQFWFDDKPKDIMEFSRVRDKFYRHVKDKLKSDDPILSASFQQRDI